VRLLYFAWLRETIGCAGESVDLPAGVATVRDLMVWQRGRGEHFAAAFANQKLIRCAVDQEFAGLDAAIGQASEIAFFPPVTGG
jgi:molybdopterin synthase sulfur carrier subunit